MAVIDDLCGSTFWDWERSWNTTDPDFTPCFHSTVLLWIPCFFLWVSASYVVYTALGSRTKNIPWSVLNILKFLFLTLLSITQILALGHYQFFSAFGVATMEWYGSLIRLLTFGLAIFLEILNKRQGIRTSGVLFIFWTLAVLCEVPTLRTLVQNAEAYPKFSETFTYALEIVYALLILVAFILSCFADKEPEYDADMFVSEKPSPERSASFLSRICFFWFESLARKGRRKPLEFSDLWDLSPENTSKVLNVPFTKYWDDNLNKTHSAPESKAVFKKTNSSVDINYKPDRQERQETKKDVGLMPIIGRAFGPTFFVAAVLKFLQDILMFASPLILSLIISHVQSSEERWKGYFYVFLLFSASLLSTFIGNQYFYLMHLIGLRIRTTIVGSLYRKALRMSSTSREDSTIGEIVNLMSVDAQKLTELCPYLTILWSAPFQIALSLYFLYQLLGASVFAGLGAMFLLLPVNIVVGIKVKGCQVKQMKAKDKRLNLMNEILAGIKVLKLYAWEPPFERQVMGIRTGEVKVIKDSAYITAGAMFLWTCAPMVVAIVTFATYILSDESNVLDARKAFVSLALLNIMRVPFNLLPMMMVSIIQASVGVKRINKFMNSEEIDKDAVQHNPDEVEAVVIENGNFAWKEDVPTLRNINLRISDGSLVAIVGVVGSGKSSLLAAMLGDINRQSGRVNARGRMAYISQQAWIQNASVRDNITFGRAFDEAKYKQVIEACALQPDLDILPAGDRTEIGEKGINLSGGQKQRVALARAAYQNCDVYLLDDPLSAVDSNIGKHIFENVIGPSGILQKKTRVLVTHSVTYLPKMNNIVVLKDGEISEAGTYRELLEKKEAFAEFLIQYLGDSENEEEDVKDILNDLEQVMGSKELIRSRKSVDGKSALHVSNGNLNHSLNNSRVRRSSSTDKISKKKKENLIEAEEMEIGTIKWGVFLYYLKAIGLPMTLTSIFMQVSYQVFAVGSNIWLAVWSNEIPAANHTQEGRNMYLGVYTAMGAGQALTIFLGTIVMAAGALKASNQLHENLLHRILRVPMWFFDTTPLGRILNRFSKDVDVTDNSVPMSLTSWIKCLLNVIASFAIITFSTPMFIVVIIPTSILYFLAQRFYVATSRQLKRLESVSRSPIYSHFTETLTGSSTIRAFGMQENFIIKSESIVDNNQMCYFPSIVSARFLAVFLEIVGNIVILFAALFAIVYGDMLSKGVVGLSLSYALQITQALNWMVETTNNVENNLVAVERLKEYGEVEQEAEWKIEEDEPPDYWPDAGEVTFSHYNTRYRKELDTVLEDVNCHIQPGEKIGIVGRTGAGKSSFALALFRLIESTGGSIVIDGQDISKMGLHDLRRNLTIIPQDPVIFSGTVRTNLDPFSVYSDEAIWRALELSHFKSFIKGVSSGLDYELSEGGENLSVGQRQLICLARALLRKTKILVLDEATAAVDLETDDLIQATIRQEFKDATILTIAHRLNTIMDYTRIMVLHKGTVKEFDTPSNLLKDKDSMFYAMAKDAGLV